MTQSLATTQPYAEALARMVAAKDKLLHFPGGMSLSYVVTSTIEEANDFGLPGGWNIINKMLWPTYFVSTSGTGINGKVDERLSTYDFVQHESKAVLLMWPHAGYIYPGRFMFSSGGSVYFKWLHWAEGFQLYELSNPQSVPDSFPACLSLPDFNYVGSALIGDLNCDHFQGPNEDIWLSKHPRKPFVVRRVVRYPCTNYPKSITEILEYGTFECLPDFDIPTKLRKSDYWNPETDADKAGRISLQLNITLTTFEVGKVTEQELHFKFPTGFQVSDAINDTTYPQE